MTSLTSARTQRNRAINTRALDGTGEQLVKSRQRVRAYGEVFTPRSMVNQMLDLVRTELESGPDFVDQTFLEPSAGDGNFLIAILQRKLHAIKKRYQPETWPTESLFALASIYGIELLEDNVAAAKTGLLEEFVAFHEECGVRCNYRTNLWRSAKHLIDVNIVQGNTLTGLDVFGEKIEFSWWNRVRNLPGMVQREPFTFISLREANAGAFDFTIYDKYKQCRIEHVHKEVKTDD